jgi:hypothetical protein
VIRINPEENHDRWKPPNIEDPALPRATYTYSVLLKNRARVDAPFVKCSGKGRAETELLVRLSAARSARCTRLRLELIYFRTPRRASQIQFGHKSAHSVNIGFHSNLPRYAIRAHFSLGHESHLISITREEKMNNTIRVKVK